MSGQAQQIFFFLGASVEVGGGLAGDEEAAPIFFLKGSWVGETKRSLWDQNRESRAEG